MQQTIVWWYEPCCGMEEQTGGRGRAGEDSGCGWRWWGGGVFPAHRLMTWNIVLHDGTITIGMLQDRIASLRLSSIRTVQYNLILNECTKFGKNVPKNVM